MAVPKTPEFEAAAAASRKLVAKPTDDELLDVSFTFSLLSLSFFPKEELRDVCKTDAVH